MIDPWEVVMIGAIIAALLVWGPKKIPELAKSLARRNTSSKRPAEENTRGTAEKFRTSNTLRAIKRF